MNGINIGVNTRNTNVRVNVPVANAGVAHHGIIPGGCFPRPIARPPIFQPPIMRPPVCFPQQMPPVFCGGLSGGHNLQLLHTLGTLLRQLAAALPCAYPTPCSGGCPTPKCPTTHCDPCEKKKKVEKKENKESNTCNIKDVEGNVFTTNKGHTSEKFNTKGTQVGAVINQVNNEASLQVEHDFTGYVGGQDQVNLYRPGNVASKGPVTSIVESRGVGAVTIKLGKASTTSNPHKLFVMAKEGIIDAPGGEIVLQPEGSNRIFRLNNAKTVSLIVDAGEALTKPSAAKLTSESITLKSGEQAVEDKQGNIFILSKSTTVKAREEAGRKVKGFNTDKEFYGGTNPGFGVYLTGSGSSRQVTVMANKRGIFDKV